MKELKPRMETPKTYVFYHSADFDGKCSGAIVAMAHDWNVELCPINYNDEFPMDKIQPIDTVYMVDFGLQPFSRMVSLDERCKLIWIDHHVTAIEDYNRYIENAGGRPIDGYRKIGEAACELSWKYFFGQSSISKPVYLMGRFDVWKHHDCPHAIPFQYGLNLIKNTRPQNRELWEKLIIGTDETFINEIISTGEKIWQYEQNKYASMCRIQAFETEFDGLKAIAMNIQPASSLVFNSIWDDEKYDCMIAFARTGGKWNISMYTDKDGIDVGVICKQRGGGGHKGAAGFSCEELPFKH